MQATTWSSVLCLAFQTLPMAPRPIGSRSSYRRAMVMPALNSPASPGAAPKARAPPTGVPRRAWRPVVAAVPRSDADAAAPGTEGAVAPGSAPLAPPPGSLEGEAAGATVGSGVAGGFIAASTSQPR
ncbi:MAG TPA: hypothetical protein VFS43_30340 [Polyangiaceae bacterium]|nr:hypothetical protein [Polyangiaceae bacterium]